MESSRDSRDDRSVDNNTRRARVKVEVKEEDGIPERVRELTQEVHNIKTRLIKEKQENLRLNTTIKSQKDLLHDMKTSLKSHLATEDNLRACIRALHKHMKGLLRKLEQEFKNEGVDGPTVTAKFHQIELLNELIDLLDVKLNARSGGGGGGGSSGSGSSGGSPLKKRRIEDAVEDDSSPIEHESRAGVKTEGYNSNEDSPSNCSYASENFVHIKQETGDQSTPPPEAGAPTPRLYIGGLGAVSKDGTFICRLVGQIAQPVDIRCGVRGFAFVTFHNAEDANKVMQMLTKDYPKLHVNFTPVVEEPECGPSATLWIGNINIALSGETTIYNAVKESGEFCVIALKSTNGSGLPYAFANFKTVESATRARAYLRLHFPLLKIRYWDSVPEFVGKYLGKFPANGNFRPEE